MALIFPVGVWLLLGWFVGRARKQSGTVADVRTSVSTDVAVGLESVPTEIPDTVLSDWLQAYRAEHRG
jgi:hypothetical protein